VRFLARAAAVGALLLGLSAAPAHAGPILFIIGDADDFGGSLSFDDALLSDRRSAAEASATNGAQLTDIYAAFADPDWCDIGDVSPDCSPNGVSGSFVVPFGGILESASISMRMADFQCALWGPLSADVNGIPLPFCYDHGLGVVALEQIVLTPEMIAAANLAGQIVLNLSLGRSLDYVAFDYFQVDAEVVPEPATLVLFGAGMVIVWGRVRRRRLR
jgi:hypothetical protein